MITRPNTETCRACGAAGGHVERRCLCGNCPDPQEPLIPQVGEISVCTHCGELSVQTEKGLEPTTLGQVAKDDPILAVILAIHVASIKFRNERLQRN